LLVSAHEQLRLASDFHPDRLTATLIASASAAIDLAAGFGYPRTRYFPRIAFFLHFRQEKLCA
jgi:hypothetical protein